MIEPMIPEDNVDLIAAEYVLGVLDSAAAHAVELDANNDPLLAARIEAWRERLYPLMSDADTIAPAYIWHQIMAQIVAGDDVTDSPLAANDNVLLQSLRRWRIFGGLITAVAAALFLIIAIRPPTAAVPVAGMAPLVATLAAETVPSAVALTYDAASGRLVTAPTALRTNDKVVELWLIAEDGVPHSLGVMQNTHASITLIDPRLRAMMHSGVTLAVTIEPVGGSPSGKPTSAPIISGKLIRV